MKANPKSMEEIGMIPWHNVLYKLCDNCKLRKEHCWLIKGQWLCMVCRCEKYGSKKGGD